jgi:hypothetical protein
MARALECAAAPVFKQTGRPVVFRRPAATAQGEGGGNTIQYNTIQYMFGIETRPGTSQRADSP